MGSTARLRGGVTGRVDEVEVVTTVGLDLVDTRLVAEIREVLVTEPEPVPEDGVTDPAGRSRQKTGPDQRG